MFLLFLYWKISSRMILIFLKSAEFKFILNSAIIGKTFSGCTCIAPRISTTKKQQVSDRVLPPININSFHYRLNTIMDYDRIVLMKDGQVLEIGPPQELLKDKCSHFRAMAMDAGISINCS